MFQGFSQNAIDFLWGISLNNERGWFMAHKQDFTDYVDVPMRELGKAVFSALAEDYPKQDWRLHVCRIYRDARRLHGRGPYKEHLWFTIERPHERFESVPALYFELAPNYYSYGCGYWDAGAATMAKLRARIDNDPKPLERLARRLCEQKPERFAICEMRKYASWYLAGLSGWHAALEHLNQLETLDAFCGALADQLNWLAQRNDLLPHPELAPAPNLDTIPR